MSVRLNRAPSLRRLLFIWLVLPLSAMLIVTALLAYPFVVHAVRKGYDEALMDSAHSLARLLPALGNAPGVELTTTADAVQRADQYDRIYYSVHARDGTFVGGDRELSAPPFDDLERGELLYDARAGGEPVRVAALLLPLKGAPVYIQAAETKVKRQRLTQQILFGVVVVEALLLATVALLVWIGIGRGLTPLHRLSREIAFRSPRDLRAIPEEQVPAEARSIVSGLNHLLQRLSALLSSQQDFVSNTAHQLRTPLAGLQVEIEYALQRSSPDDWRRALETLAPLGSRMAHLVNQLLTLARTDGGAALTQQMGRVDLHRQIADVAGQWMPQAIAKDIDLGLELGEAKVWGNAFLLHELISNLVENAIAYSSAGGRVTVRTRTEDSAVMIEVEDDGIGIPAEERDNVLRRFYRVPGAPGAGSGLGLAIVREIAELHAARVHILEPASGRGTLVCIRFDGTAA